MAIVEYVRNRQSVGHVITNSELRKYAKQLVNKENSNFTASASWAQNFLLRHKLNLAPSPAPPLRDPHPSPSHMLSETPCSPNTSQLITDASQSPSITMDTMSPVTGNPWSQPQKSHPLQRPPFSRTPLGSPGSPALRFRPITQLTLLLMIQ